MKVRAVSYKGEKCEKCGYDRSIAAMDFHHRSPSEKDFHIGNGRTKQWEDVKAELDKCDLLCKNCHAEIHESWRAASVDSQKRILKGHSKSLPVNVPCSYCNKLIRKTPSQLRYTHWFCDKACQAAFRVTPPISGQNQVGKCKIMWPSDEVLKDLVWQKPLTLIAKDLGVSDKAVKKRCVKLNVKTPGFGYWAKLKSEMFPG